MTGEGAATGPGNYELTKAELRRNLVDELPERLPLEGWRTETLHCQIDAIGPSELHPDLVQLTVSFPPAAEKTARKFRRD